MTRTLASLCLAALALGPTACLGDDPDHIPTTGYSGGVTKGGGGHVVAAPGPTTLRTALVSALRGGEPGPAIGAPELCGDCAVTIVRALLGATVELTVRDDRGDEICRVIGSREVISVDSCGVFDEMY